MKEWPATGKCDWVIVGWHTAAEARRSVRSVVLVRIWVDLSAMVGQCSPLRLAGYDLASSARTGPRSWSQIARRNDEATARTWMKKRDPEALRGARPNNRRPFSPQMTQMSQMAHPAFAFIPLGGTGPAPSASSADSPFLEYHPQIPPITQITHPPFAFIPLGGTGPAPSATSADKTSSTDLRAHAT